MPVQLNDLATARLAGKPLGITSVCSAHPLVLRAALRFGRDTGGSVLIEATCNQVNHQGGYTGMTPEDFVAKVKTLAQKEGCPMDQVLLGGDHLGPNPWRHLPQDQAMTEAEKMVSAYVAAGFRKLHLDTSMGCADEPPALDDRTTAARAARLGGVAEATAARMDAPLPQYILGTEVPPPGGADHVLDSVPPTDPDAARKTIAVHREVFEQAGLSETFNRVIGIVVQPGVEFGNQNVIRYDRAPAQALCHVLDDEPALVFEAHSTDYQGTLPLSHLVQDGFAILKVGPELTFVLREALYALDLIASDLLPDYGARPLMQAMEALMLEAPGNWDRHYSGPPETRHLLRHYSLSDRIRYYWAMPQAQAAVTRLMDSLHGLRLPLPLIWQHLPGAEAFADTPLNPEELLIWRITCSLDAYHTACAPQT